MMLPELLRRIKEADAKESMELFKQYPDLARQCAEQIEKELNEHTVGRAVTYDGADYQRLVDRGIIRRTSKKDRPTRICVSLTDLLDYR